MNPHIGEDAELYAVGSLSGADRDAVDQHVATCSQCAQRVDEASRTVAQIAAAQPIYEPSSLLRERLASSVSVSARRPAHWALMGLALAACLAIAFIPTWLAVDRTRVVSQSMEQDEHALARIASAPTFRRAEFMSNQRPTGAHVLYGPRGDWYYVMVLHPTSGMQVAYVHGRRMELLGRLVMHGESGTLYLPVNHKMEQLALLQNDTVVASAHLVY